MKCTECGREYKGTEILDTEVYPCPACINESHETDMAQHRAKRLHYTNELVTIGKVDFECTGYIMPGNPATIYEAEVKVNGQTVYGYLASYLQDQIDHELLRRVQSEAIVKRLKEIEKLLPDSKDPAGLRLKRSDLEGRLEALEVGHERD